MQLRDGREVRADAVVLDPGHSARDIYELCSRRGIHLESKPYAMGVRIEHPQAMIDEIQYGGLAAHPQLGAAPYSLNQTVDGIGVYSFCMCPGGFIVPAATQSGQLVVNGMSPSKRNSKFANSGFVVTVDEAVYGDGVLDGLTYQAEVEKAAYAAGGEGLRHQPSESTILWRAESQTVCPNAAIGPVWSHPTLTRFCPNVSPGQCAQRSNISIALACGDMCRMKRF